MVFSHRSVLSRDPLSLSFEHLLENDAPKSTRATQSCEQIVWIAVVLDPGQSSAHRCSLGRALGFLTPLRSVNHDHLSLSIEHLFKNDAPNQPRETPSCEQIVRIILVPDPVQSYECLPVFPRQDPWFSRVAPRRPATHLSLALACVAPRHLDPQCVA